MKIQTEMKSEHSPRVSVPGPARIGVPLLLLGTFTLNSLAQSSKPVAQLPRVYLDTSWNLPTGGTTWAAHDVTQLRTALTNSVPGDVIVWMRESPIAVRSRFPRSRIRPTMDLHHLLAAGQPAGGDSCVSRQCHLHAENRCTRRNRALHSCVRRELLATGWIELTAASNYPTDAAPRPCTA